MQEGQPSPRKTAHHQCPATPYYAGSQARSERPRKEERQPLHLRESTLVSGLPGPAAGS